MPELAEVEFSRRQWDAGLLRQILDVRLHPSARTLREIDPARLRRGLRGVSLTGSWGRGKWMLFATSAQGWLGIHLGMSGRLLCRDADSGSPASIQATGRESEARFSRGTVQRRHEHLVIVQEGRHLVFADARQFGRVRFDRGTEPPAWWRELPPDILSSGFRRQRLEEFLARHPGAPIKGVLLLQEGFPGIGNWMADEILWRAGIHPARTAATLRREELARLFAETRRVARLAMSSVGVRGSDPPRGWLFHQRWADGGHCPATGVPLVRERIGGRTTCWSPGRQVPPSRGRR